MDFGTDSCRALIIDAATGEEIATSVQYYPRWKKGLFCDPAKNRFRQHPLDYIESMETSIKEVVAQAGAEVASRIAGIAFDTTGSTPILVNKEGVPLAMMPEHAENPNAMFVLWKDHTAIREADEINKLAKEWKIDYTAYEGGIYSSEWVWAKVLHVLREDESIRSDAYSWVEHCDWMPAILTGKTKPAEVVRSRCAAGHKAMWLEEWGGLPDDEFLTTLDPLLKGMRSRLFTETHPGDTRVGKLTPEWAARLGLSTDVCVAGSAFDCHFGAVGGEIAPGTFLRVMGTSTCDIMVTSYEELKDCLIPGICGQVDGSVIPGMIGLEAGQSAFGDLYAWFKNVVSWPIEQLLAKTTLVSDAVKEQLKEEMLDNIIPALSDAAERIPLEESTLLATDWVNGRRTPDANQWVKGSILGLTLGSSAPLIFRALVEATAFGSKAIINRFIENGLKINEVIAIGGISQKSPFVMQTLADVLGMPIKVSASEQACALGSGMFAAVAAGIYNKIEDAQKAMGAGFSREYQPDKSKYALYMEKYREYLKLGELTEKNFFAPQNN